MHYAEKEPTRETTPVAEPVLNPTSLDKPAFLLNVPFSYSTETPNNAWMEELDEKERRPTARKAMRQFLELYHFLAGDSLVLLLPAPADCRLQDVVFTANLGIVLDHLPDRNTVVLSNFATAPRRGETRIGLKYFKSLGYDVHVPPFKFEGEAELKHLHDNVYIGGFGIRSQFEAYEWMERMFDLEIIKVEEVDSYLYHLDCTVFPLTRESTVVCTEMFTKKEIRKIERHTDIIDVTADDCYSGICNSVRLGNSILNASHIHDLKPGHEHYAPELAKNRRLEDIALAHGFEVSYFNLSEYMKAGALLSCMVMHLNRNSYGFTLV
jgi:N-dimethylarginine dimethylaminohydrolase